MRTVSRRFSLRWTSSARMDSMSTAGRQMSDNQKQIVGFALKSRLPSMYGTEKAVDAGGLMYYGADLAESYRRVAYYVDKILKGAKPADLRWSSRRSSSW